MKFQNDLDMVKPRWPRHLVVPLEKEFIHGLWIMNDNRDLSDVPGSCEHLGRDEMSKAKSRALRYDCNTQCCLVGWVALAFGEKGVDPDAFENPASAEFMNKLIELAGAEPVNPDDCDHQEGFIQATAQRASHLFEGHQSDGSWRRGSGMMRKLTPKEARSLWKKAGASFNYDTANLVE